MILCMFSRFSKLWPFKLNFYKKKRTGNKRLTLFGGWTSAVILSIVRNWLNLKNQLVINFEVLPPQFDAQSILYSSSFRNYSTDTRPTIRCQKVLHISAMSEVRELLGRSARCSLLMSSLLCLKALWHLKILDLDEKILLIAFLYIGSFSEGNLFTFT